MKKSWQLGRRTVLKAAGVSMALPWLEAMGAPADQQELPRRMCAILFPFEQRSSGSEIRWNTASTLKDTR